MLFEDDRRHNSEQCSLEHLYQGIVDERPAQAYSSPNRRGQRVFLFSSYENVVSNNNAAISTNALWHNTDGGENTAIGTSALYLNTIGIQVPLNPRRKSMKSHSVP